MDKKEKQTPENEAILNSVEELKIAEENINILSDVNIISENFSVLPLNIIERGGNVNMYNAVNEVVQTVNPNANVLFATDRVRSNRSNACCGGWLSHDIGSGLFTLVNNNKCGCATFKIDFNANIATTATTVTPLALAIKSNGEQIAGTEMDYTSNIDNTYGNVSASTIVVVPCGASKTISIGNILTASTLVKNANIIIEKDC